LTGKGDFFWNTPFGASTSSLFFFRAFCAKSLYTVACSSSEELLTPFGVSFGRALCVGTRDGGEYEIALALAFPFWRTRNLPFPPVSGPLFSNAAAMASELLVRPDAFSSFCGDNDLHFSVLLFSFRVLGRQGIVPRFCAYIFLHGLPLPLTRPAFRSAVLVCPCTGGTTVSWSSFSGSTGFGEPVHAPLGNGVPRKRITLQFPFFLRRDLLSFRSSSFYMGRVARRCL